MEEQQYKNSDIDEQRSETPPSGFDASSDERNWKSKIELRSEEVQEVLGGVPHWILRRGILMLALFLIVLLIGSWFFKYPEIISSQLTLTTANPPANIIAKTSGKISGLFAADLQEVQAGQTLALIENPAQLKDIFYLDTILQNLIQSIDKSNTFNLHRKELKLGNLQSSYSNMLLQLEAHNNFVRLNYYPRKIASIRNVLNAREKLLTSSEKQKDIVIQQHELEKNAYEREKILKYKNITTDDSFDKATGQYLQSEMSVNNLSASLEGMRIEILQLQESLVDMEQQYIEKKNTLNASLKTTLNQLQSDIATWKMNYLLSSPIKGKLTFTEIWAENQNVTVGKIVFTVVPDTLSELVGKARLPIDRSGKVKAGQDVNIRFNNFPDNQFGMVKGIVKSLSLIPTEEGNYIVEIAFPNGLKTSYNKELPLSQEMTARADIITENTRLIEQFFLPLKQLLKNQ